MKTAVDPDNSGVAVPAGQTENLPSTATFFALQYLATAPLSEVNPADHHNRRDHDRHHGVDPQIRREDAL